MTDILNTKLIPLTQGKFAIVDDIDYETLLKYKWCAQRNSSGTWYARRKDHKTNAIVYMHRCVLNLKDWAQRADHVNGNGLDNRRMNLRICTQSQNLGNRKKSINKSSKYKGVCLCRSTNKWRAEIMRDYKHEHLGYFHSEKAATLAYNAAALKVFGDFAFLNEVNYE